ncbi:aldehyde dehydrogenase [Anoxybacillus sp. LAT_35]|uniref:aldehyde dehydrogenase n=1 Tax=unclassified Anoxybacillus TaxID=2639704 RepID=UPI001EDBFBF1|nr:MULTISPECIES: aldehyde dehydrogenase [unclassified Anoxybacillus]MCG5025623.1 aldehyde dehydrogenase [Anoxybacillus flavithermus]MCG6197058.1 aldehyde dehydrogenase [Anoxybacillus sp. LAT_38]MCG3085361.1 aldehyde dehydrogenase [Anoxybacillus sp. LAT27]MCG6172365.1 aldehyde dehydrogenase [Anoxybacillus sp. LAT_11]MCG6175671.1 aldehyde dehydrogenase [Anoxybacillus sp. LAT_31]
MEQLLQKQKHYFQTGETLSLEFRLKQLIRLKEAIQKYEQIIIDTLKKELHKSPFEAYTTEIGIVYEEIHFITKRLARWMKRKRVPTPLTHFGSKSYIYPEPYGVSLIIAPWNYPFQLAISPLIGAIAAGNCAIVKPSEYTPAMSALLKTIVSEAFPEEYVAVVEGGVDVGQQLLNLRFDHIFFTGSVPVGKIVMEAAAKHLTPVTLELGGKSPAIVDASAHIDLAAKRIVWGKFLNVGQTCIAPDYVFVHASVKSLFIERMKRYIEQLYGHKDTYSRIVTVRHTERLVRFLSSGTVVHGGTYDIEQRWIEPTLLDDVTWDDEIMQEEIFGPILPILTFQTVDEAIQMINNYEKPLALYLFSEDRNVQRQVLQQVRFGGGCINDTIMHIANPHLPFGGVGQSGIGAYHGKASFDAFTHYKSVLKQTTKFDIPLRYPNFPNALKWVRKLLR